MKKRYLGLLCALSAAACATNKPAEAPPESARSDATPLMATTPAVTPVSDGAVEPVNAGHSPGATDATASLHETGNSGSKATHPASDATPATSDSKTMDASVAPDNTKRNKQDAKGSPPTPLDQGEGQADLDITKKIRQAVVGDGSLSFTAKNVKIITRDGKVTLRGPVNTSEERSTIQAAAQKVAGPANVDNQLEVKK